LPYFIQDLEIEDELDRKIFLKKMNMLYQFKLNLSEKMKASNRNAESKY